VSQRSLLSEIRSSAVISEDGQYRYELERWWGKGPGVLWIMLNPSKADADIDDPTIRRCRSFAERWAHGGIGVVNLFAYRSTEPNGLLEASDPVGPRNEAFIRRWMQWQDTISLVVVAWGAWPHKLKDLPDADDSIRSIAGDVGRPLWCLGKTAGGHPKHPLYQRGDSVLERWA
jgi:hypothetical protein